MSSIIVDIDGTIADCSHRRVYLQGVKKDWASFFGAMCLDDPIMPVIHLVQKLQLHGIDILFCTGRPAVFRPATEHWLNRFDLSTQYLYMRKNSDYREDYIVKSEMLDQIYNDGFLPTLAIDDRQSVVDMWRSRGLICLQNKDEVY